MMWMRWSRFLGTISTLSIRNLFSRSISTKHPKSATLRTSSRSDQENTPPTNLNISVNHSLSLPAKSPSKMANSEKAVAKSDCRNDVTTTHLDQPVKEDMFQLVGVPSVKNALAGYNTSILLYGQTGSGKTYTMWGPPSAMVEDPSPSSHQGIVPCIFQMLFSEIQREQENLDGKQISYSISLFFS